MIASTNTSPELEPAPPSVYLDTGIPSRLTGRPARYLRVLRDQRITCLWWNGYRWRVKAFVSDLVVAEAGRGHPEAAQRRIDAISSLPFLEVTDEAKKLAKHILRETKLPSCATEDATHIATAALHGMDFLLTWNCKHLANPEILPHVRRTCKRAGVHAPEICTPEDIIRRFKNGNRPIH